MKHPLRLVLGPRDVRIADASGMIVCTMEPVDYARELAEHIVSTANRWHRWRKWFRPYTSEDWVWEKNERRVRTINSDLR